MDINNYKDWGNEAMEHANQQTTCYIKMWSCDTSFCGGSLVPPTEKKFEVLTHLIDVWLPQSF